MIALIAGTSLFFGSIPLFLAANYIAGKRHLGFVGIIGYGLAAFAWFCGAMILGGIANAHILH